MVPSKGFSGQFKKKFRLIEYVQEPESALKITISGDEQHVITI